MAGGWKIIGRDVSVSHVCNVAYHMHRDLPADNTKRLLGQSKARVAEPFRARDADAWVRPVFPVPPPVTAADVDAAEAALGFAIPPLLRRLYTEVGNGRWGPVYGLDALPDSGSPPTENDMVGFYLACTAPERALEAPAVQWPRGLVRIIDLGCVAFEVCDFLTPPYPVYKLDGDTWGLERPVVEALIPVAPSLAERMEMWLASS